MAHDTEGSHPHGEKDSKLYLVRSPIVHTASVASLPALGATESQGDIERFGFRDDAPDCPEFEKVRRQNLVSTNTALPPSVSLFSLVSPLAGERMLTGSS